MYANRACDWGDCRVIPLRSIPRNDGANFNDFSSVSFRGTVRLSVQACLKVSVCANPLSYQKDHKPSFSPLAKKRGRNSPLPREGSGVGRPCKKVTEKDFRQTLRIYIENLDKYNEIHKLHNYHRVTIWLKNQASLRRFFYILVENCPSSKKVSHDFCVLV